MVKQNLSEDVKKRIACILLDNSTKLKPNHGIFKTIATQFDIDRKTVYTIWKSAKEMFERDEPLSLISKIKGKTGRTRIEFPLEQIKALPKSDRCTLRRFGEAIGRSPSTIRRWVESGQIKSHTNAIHPLLSLENKYVRLNFVLSKLYFDRIVNAIKFRTMDFDCHMDEKWFYISRDNQRYYLANGEEEPYRACQSKKFITKVMFMAVVSRPLYDDDKNVIFDGKIGLFPFTYQEPAKRTSKNRIKGTPQTKPIATINKAVTKAMLINEIIPALKAKWPATASKTIKIQQDNARPHLNGVDSEFVEAATSHGFNITLDFQPANSPDLNVLDLGFFASIQSLQTRKAAKTVDDLVKNVQEAWEELSPDTLDNVWLSLQGVMVEIMKRMGHNDYKLPHLNKQAQRREGTLPRDLTVSDDLVKECIHYLQIVNKLTPLAQLMSDMGMPM